MAGTYVMMFGIANIVAGGPIYDRNKVKYLEERGWRVIVFPMDDGEVYIQGLERYSGAFLPFMTTLPYAMSKKELKKCLKIMVERIPDSSEVIIETGTDYTACWGEVLAKELHAKHIIMFLDEKNDHVNHHTAPFYEFKYKRGELASISLPSLEFIFGRYFELSDSEHHVLSACCTNSVEEIESKFADMIIRGDYNIGTIGRMDKSYVGNIVNGVCEFADTVPDKKVVLCFIGGAEQRTIDAVLEQIELYSNITCYISGYMWPIPASIFKKMDVFVSGAGSAVISAEMHVPTIRMDVLSNQPVGFLTTARWWEANTVVTTDKSLCEYLTQVLVIKEVPKIYNSDDASGDWEWICKQFDEHMQFINKSDSNREYFDVENMKDGKIQHVIGRKIMAIVGYKNYLRARKMYCKLFKKCE